MSILNNLLIKEIINADSQLPLTNSVNLLLALKQTSVPKLAMAAGISRQAAYLDIKGIKPSPRFRKTITKIFGCVPWS